MKIITRKELELLYRTGGDLALPDDYKLSPELASLIADIILDEILGGIGL